MPFTGREGGPWLTRECKAPVKAGTPRDPGEAQLFSIFIRTYSFYRNILLNICINKSMRVVERKCFASISFTIIVK